MPHFTVEAQGGTNPLDVSTVYATLVQASGAQNSGMQGIKVATEQLSNWESQSGYYSALQDVYTSLSLDQSVRYQAIIQLKNGIDKHWRKGSNASIGKEEKLKIKTTAIEAGLSEPVRALALHNALMVAKIVRSEFPHDWPNVITTLVDHLRQATLPETTSEYTANILTMTLYIVKELATGRLQRTRKSLQSVATELLQVLGTLYVRLVEKWLAYLREHSNDQGGAVDDVQNSYYALKTIRRLIIVGFEHPHRESVVRQLWEVLRQQQDAFWSIWQHAEQEKDLGTYVDDVVTKHLFQMSKLHLEMARNHPASFILLPGALDLLGRYWTAITQLGQRFGAEMTLQEWKRWKVNSDGDKVTDIPPLEKLALKGLLLLRACLKMVYQPAQTFKYQQPQDKEEKKIAVETVSHQVLTEAFVLSMMETMVTQFFVLRPSDLRDWEEEPDEWEKREEEIADAWEFSLRSCSEKLFLDLVINYKELLVPRILQVFYQYANPSNTEVFLKDSLYSAIGIAAACLEDKLDFNSFLLQTLVPEVQIVQPHYNLLRRRIAIVLGQWVPIKPESLDRRAIYQIFTHLLSKSDELNDVVVRVTAGRQLRLVLEPFEFNQADFAPFAASIFQNLMSLIQETELSETKMALLETVRVAVSKLEGHIEPYSDAIMSLLPALWAASGEEHLMKQATLTMITAITTSLKRKSLRYHSLIIPLIRDSVQPGSEAIVYLLEEALELWPALLQQTPSADPPPSAELLTLSTSLLPLAETGSESLRSVFDIVESYIILSPNTILSPAILSPLLTALRPMFEERNHTRLSDVSKASHVVETLIASLSMPSHFDNDDVRQQVLQRLLSTFVSTGFLPTILNNLKAAYTYHQDPRPSHKPPDVIGPKETSLFSILSHIALQSPQMFLEVIETGSSPGSFQTASWLIPEWIANFDAVGSIQDKKLQTLAITNLLSSSATGPPKIMLEQLQSLMTLWTDVVTALGDEAPEESQGDYLWYGYTNNAEVVWADEAPEEGRRRELSQVDPVHKVNLRVFVGEKLREVVGAVGMDVFQQWVGQVDGAVVNAFGALGLI